MKRGPFLPPALLQVVGVLLLIGAAVFWAFTGHQSALLVGAALSLIGLGAYSGLRISFSKELSPLDDEKGPEPPESR